MGALETALDQDRATADGEIDATELGTLTELLDLAGCENPVAGGYSKAVELYDAYVRTQNALGDEPTDEERQAARAAQMDRDAYGGEVYDAVYNQQMRLAAVNKARTDYNDLVGTGGTYALLKTGYDAIVTTTYGNTDSDGNTLSGDELTASQDKAYGMGAVRGYRAIAGNDVADDTSVGDEEFNAAFNRSGVLQFADTIGADGLASTSITTFGEITAEYEKWKQFAKAEQEILDDAIAEKNVDLAPLQERARRAAKARDHVLSELTRLKSVARGQNRAITAIDLTPSNTANDPEVANEQTLLSRYDRVNRDLESAASTVRSTVKSLDDANKALMSKLGDADSYLSQLVRLRQYEKSVAEQNLADAGAGAAQSFRDAVKTANEALSAAQTLQTTHMNLAGDPDSPGSSLLSALLESDDDKEDDGLALINAVSDVHDATVGNKDEIDTLKETLTDAAGNPIDLMNLDTGVDELTAMDDPDTEADERGQVTINTDEIGTLDGRVATNEEDLDTVWEDLRGMPRGVESQHDGQTACTGAGLLNKVTCAEASIAHNAGDIDDLDSDLDDLSTQVDDNEDTLSDHATKLEEKKLYIETLQAELGMDVEGNSGIEGSRIDHNETRSMDNATVIADETKARVEADTALGGRIDAEEKARTEADTALGGRIDAEASAREMADTALGGRIDDEETARMGADLMLSTAIAEEASDRASADMTLATAIDGNTAAIAEEASARMGADMMLAGALDEEAAARASADMALDSRVGSNAGAIAANMNAIGSNASAISDNRNMIGELSDDLDVVRAGVAASMALAGMPAINGRGISIGVGSFDGESAFAVGFQIQGEQASFKVGITSGGGATGASAGVGFNF